MTFTTDEETTLKLMVAEMKAKIKFNIARTDAMATTNALKIDLETAQLALTTSFK